MYYKPRPYQKYATEFILNNRQAGLFLDMGLGKTVSTLTAIRDLILDRLDVEKVLVIAPKRVAQVTWPEELAKWDHLQGLRMVVLQGSAVDRRRALREDADIYVINRELVPWLIDEVSDARFDMLVIDELSSFKSPGALRFKALRRLKFDRVVGLTGTPGNLLDLWAEMYLIDRGQRLGRSVTAFREQYFKPGRRNGHIIYEWVPRPGSDEAIHDRIRDICVSMTAADYLQLPDRMDQYVYVDIPDAARAVYDELIRTQMIGEITAANAAVVSGMLQQLANGAIYTDPEAHLFDVIHDEKLNAAEEIIEAADGPVLVFYKFIHDRIRLEQRFGARVLDTAEDIAAWNRGEIPVALAHPASAGHGLNLQTGGHTIIWFGLDWWLEGYQQANARLHRSGQLQPVQIYHIIARNTIDERIVGSLRKKAVTQADIIDAVKACIGGSHD